MTLTLTLALALTLTITITLTLTLILTAAEEGDEVCRLEALVHPRLAHALGSQRGAQPA